MLIALGLGAWASTAWAGNAQGQDGGDTVQVGVSTSSLTGQAGVPVPRGARSGSGPSCTYTPITLSMSAGAEPLPGGPTPGQWYLVQCSGSAAATGGHAEWIPTQSSDARAAERHRRGESNRRRHTGRFVDRLTTALRWK